VISRYCASRLTSLANTLGSACATGDGILLNCVCPGAIVTASFTENLKDILAADGLDATNPVDV
jgi:3-oxoacyl-[acyl-carrier protein] reductase